MEMRYALFVLVFGTEVLPGILAKKGGDWKPKLYVILYDENKYPPSEDWHVLNRFNLYEEVGKLIDLQEPIISVSAYKTRLNSFQITKFMFYHLFIIFKTKSWYYSIEKAPEGITLQRSSSTSMLLKKCRGEMRMRSGLNLMRDDIGQYDVGKLIKWLIERRELTNKYDFFSSNCKSFGKAVFNLLSKYEHLYFGAFGK